MTQPLKCFVRQTFFLACNYLIVNAEIICRLSHCERRHVTFQYVVFYKVKGNLLETIHNVV